MILVYKYRLKDRSARKTLRRHAIALNQVWNFCVATERQCKQRYWAGGPRRASPTHFDLNNLTVGSSKELGTHSGSISEVCRVFAKSRNNTHRRVPRFRASLGPRKALGWVPFRSADHQIKGNTIRYFGKTYHFFGAPRRPVPITAKSGCFVEDTAGRWYLCISVDCPGHHTSRTNAVGIDLGLTSFASLSDGSKITAPQFHRSYEERLAKAQRARNKHRVRRLHLKIKNCRKDFLHKLSTTLTRENAIIVVGNVSSSKLAKTRMAKSVLDAGWSTFRKQLRYKSQQAGVVFLEVEESFTTVTCSECGARSGPQGQKGLRIREWSCAECGAVHDRDHNSAKNILARSVTGPAEGSRESHHV